LIARIPEHEDDSDLLYDDLSEEKECVVARNGHPLLSRRDLTLKDLSKEGWILTSRVGILRNRVDTMFVQQVLIAHPMSLNPHRCR